MLKEKLNINFIVVWLYLLVGIESAFSGIYYDIQYFLQSRNKLYFIDLSIDCLDAIGLFVTLVISLKKTSEMIKILLFRIFIGIGLTSVSTLMILRFYFYVPIPSFPSELIIATLLIDGYIIKMILDKKIEPLLT